MMLKKDTKSIRNLLVISILLFLRLKIDQTYISAADPEWTPTEDLGLPAVK